MSNDGRSRFRVLFTDESWGEHVFEEALVSAEDYSSAVRRAAEILHLDLAPNEEGRVLTKFHVYKLKEPVVDYSEPVQVEHVATDDVYLGGEVRPVIFPKQERLFDDE